MKIVIQCVVALWVVLACHSAYAESIVDVQEAKEKLLECTLISAKGEAIRRGYDKVYERSNRHHRTIEQEAKRQSGRCALRAIDYAVSFRKLFD